MNSPLVSVIILNWNGKEYLPTCLDSLLEQSCKDFETIVVDNGSSDGSLELLQECYPWVHVVPLSVNSGFASGNNAGFAVSSGKLIVTLNNDTRVEPDWLAELVAPAEARQDVGMVASRICSWDEPDMIDSLGVAVCRDGMSRGSRRRCSFSALSLDRWEEILIPSACAALYRREMVEQIGFFDDDFFAYCEDTDLGLRGRLAGWGALLARDAVVYHKYPSTSGTFSPFKLYLVERNHYRAVLKSCPLSFLLLIPLFTFVRYGVQASVILSGTGSGGEFLASGSRTACIGAILRGTRDALLAFPAALRKRARVMRTRRLSNREMSALLGRYRLSFRELLDDGKR